MFDFEIARFLYRVSFLYEKIHESPYKGRAYFKAALAVDGYSKSIMKLIQDGDIQSLPNIGASIGKNLHEILETNHLKLIDDLLGDIPYTIFDLYEYANIRDRLLTKLIANKIYCFGDISFLIQETPAYVTKADKEQLYEAYMSFNQIKHQYAIVYELTNELVSILKQLSLVKDICVSDGLFFRDSTLSAGEIICSLSVELEEIIEVVQTLKHYQVMELMNDKIVLNRFGVKIVLQILSYEDYLTKTIQLESDKRNFKLKTGKKKLLSSICGDLHTHTDWSDGIHTIEQMRDYAQEFGHGYIAITDHSQSLKPSGMSELDTLMQIKKIRELNKKDGIPILSGIEVDILSDGSLDLPDRILREFDIVIAAVHSHFNQPPMIMMDRLSKALSNKYVNILAHPMGRLLGRPGKPTVLRQNLPIDFDMLLEICIVNDVALEINCFPERFDLSLENALKAVSKGAKISIGTDAHSIYHLSNINYMIEALSSANIPESSVLNTFSLKKLKKYLKIKSTNEDEVIGDAFENYFKDFNYYFSQTEKIVSGQQISIGVDLTGSEKKGSGFAVLEGAKVKTSLVYTDDEIIKKTQAINPAIVSIDSPLSLPTGRCCTSKNCNCSDFGIMRECELTLKRFGIGVYPCLIDSMVNLTLRGIKLANRLRALGYEVIESYPGVAQDLLNIPRKRKGIDLLVNGMKNFGIKDIRGDATHDEIDAITSALVGFFYLADRYVGLGNEKEDYLIVPKLDNAITGKGLVIGLVGRVAAGKTTLAEYLRFKYGFEYMRYSKLIEELYGVSGREQLQKVGLEIASNHEKQKELTGYMLDSMKPGVNYVIDGIRQMIDYENLLANCEERFTLMHVDATLTTRSNRYRKNEPNITKKAFELIDSHQVENNIHQISDRSDLIISNNGSFKELMNNTSLSIARLSNR